MWGGGGAPHQPVDTISNPRGRLKCPDSDDKEYDKDSKNKGNLFQIPANKERDKHDADRYKSHPLAIFKDC
jgi:hypothetical protein